MSAAERTCAGCGVKFTPDNPNQLYHDIRCATRKRVRRWREGKREEAATLRSDGEASRRCSEPGCATWLSSYNPTVRCAVHGGWVVHENGHGPDVEREAYAELLDELMGVAA